MLAYVKHAKCVKGTMENAELVLALNAHMQYSNWYNEHEGENGYFMGTETVKWHEDQASQAASLLVRRGYRGVFPDTFSKANRGELPDALIKMLED